MGVVGIEYSTEEMLERLLLSIERPGDFDVFLPARLGGQGNPGPQASGVDSGWVRYDRT